MLFRFSNFSTSNTRSTLKIDALCVLCRFTRNFIIFVEQAFFYGKIETRDSLEIACMNGHATHICIIIESSCDDLQLRLSGGFFCVRLCIEIQTFLMFSVVRSMTCFSVLFEHNVYKYTTTQVSQSVLLEKLRYILKRNSLVKSSQSQWEHLVNTVFLHR